METRFHDTHGTTDADALELTALQQPANELL
jgi:hypothetical protein